MLLQFWGKTSAAQGRAECPDFHPLAYHLLDVAAAADVLFGLNRERLCELAKICGVETEALRRSVVCLIALHDLGKCARGFQGKQLELWPTALGSRPAAASIVPVRHDVAGLWLFVNERRVRELAARILPDLLFSQRLLILQSIAGHHGEPLDIETIGNDRERIGEAAKLAAAGLAETIVGLFEPPPLSLRPESIPTLSFALAGLAVLADWLGSNVTWFKFRRPPLGCLSLRDELSRYWRDDALKAAASAVDQAGLIPAKAASFSGIGSLFPDVKEPTPLQQFVQSVELPEGPVLFVFEDMTGAGKTEAAIVLAHRLLADGRARGVYVALPTMATANAMFGRLTASYRKLFEPGVDPSVVLVHGRRDLTEGFRNLSRELASDDAEEAPSDDPSQTTASAFCADWIARSNKQAFLAQMGAGTIDQALLSILPARHQSLRLWGLADKVLVIDEAHAYDAYMSEELETLLRFHAALGGSAIVLSATLSGLKRSALVDAFRRGLGGAATWNPFESAYPLVTIAAAAGVQEHPVGLRDSLVREVVVRRVDDLAEAHAVALEAARHGAAVALIRNTVDEAIASYMELAAAFEGETLLFHARFAMVDRLAVEGRVLEKFGREPSTARPGILVATQVIEQSLDLDFDLIMTDLAPIDLLIQRAGRLWRHMDKRPAQVRPRFPQSNLPTLFVLSPEPLERAGASWLDTVLPKTRWVYRDSALLWRSAKVLFGAGRIRSRASLVLGLPESGEVRALVEAVYGESKIAIPSELEAAENEAMGRASAERSTGVFNVLRFEAGYALDGGRWDKDSRVHTRLSDATITLRLAVFDSGRIVPWAAREGREPSDRRGWALSEVTLRSNRCTGAPVANREITAAIEMAKEGWSISEKEMPILVFRPEEDGGPRHGLILDARSKEVVVRYSSSLGFQVP